MDPKEIVRELARWIHVIAGITWIGHLYFFNWVNGNFQPTMDAETKKKVNPELLPRALYFFRMGALFTWITGVILLGMVYYMVPSLFVEMGKDADVDHLMGGAQWACVALTFIAPFIYDFIVSGPLKDPTKAFGGGWVLATVMYFVFHQVGHFNYRGSAIHVGAMFGTIMAFNVWFRIWPAQQKILTGLKTGEAVDAALAPMAGLRSKHNTYMSVPLVFAMLNAHNTFAAPGQAGSFAGSDWIFPVIILVGFLGTYHIYQLGTKVKGF